MEYGLPEICGFAFVAVMVLLTFLAGAIRLITVLLPPPTRREDEAVIAAVSTAVATQFSGARLVHIEEVDSRL